MRVNKNAGESTGRLLAKIVRGLLAEAPVESLADLTDALKFRCARLKIPWTNDAITDAYRLIDSNMPLPRCPRGRLPRVQLVRNERPNAWPIGRAAAADLVARLSAALERRRCEPGRAR